MPDAPKISVVIPVCNEAGNLPRLYSRLSSILKDPYEIILVDDGSADASAKIIADLNQKDPRIKLISFSRNFGHMIALSAGMDAASGEVVITMDADLQHPPELLPQLIKKWEEGAEIVNAIRKETKKGGRFKQFSASFFYWLINKISRLNLTPGAADYRLLDRKVVDVLKQFHERSRFLRGLISWVGFKQAFIDYEADARYAGKSKYSFGRMFSFALDGITSFSSSPLRLSTYLGLAVALLSFLNLLYVFYIRLFTQRAIEGWTSVMTAVLFIGGVQLIFLGLLGEYLSRVYEETKQRPLYIISRKIGL